MAFLPTEVSKIIYSKYAGARNDMIETSLVSYFKELTNSMILGEIHKKHHTVGGVVINILWFKKSDGRIDITCEDFYYDADDVEICERLKAKYRDVVCISRRCVFEINGDLFGLIFDSEINFNNIPDSNLTHSWSYMLVGPNDRLCGYKGRLIANAMKMAMVEFHADTCQRTFHEDLFSFSYRIKTPHDEPDETDEVSRSKLAFVDGTITEYCRPKCRFYFPNKYWRFILYG